MLADRVEAKIDVESRRCAVASWLLTLPQLTEGAHAGGVVGHVGVGGLQTYVYPEITGYYLQWLAWQAAREGVKPALASGADAAQRWLAAWIRSSETPQTRVYLEGSERDWRNQAVFCFDFAMVLRGLASAVKASLIRGDAALISRLTASLSRLIRQDGCFDACRAAAGAALPSRWSTRRGAFMAKAAAGILEAAETFEGVDARLRRAAQATYESSVQSLARAPHDAAHPLLYAIEGAIGWRQAGERTLRQCMRHVDALLHAAETRGRVVESSSPDAVERIDILAQTLRAAYTLRAMERGPQADGDRLRAMLDILARHVTPDGAVPFAVGRGRSSSCVWAAMFTEQAFAFSRCSRRELRLYSAFLV